MIKYLDRRFISVHRAFLFPAVATILLLLIAGRVSIYDEVTSALAKTSVNIKSSNSDEHPTLNQCEAAVGKSGNSHVFIAAMPHLLSWSL